jgi:hypothetical protein
MKVVLGRRDVKLAHGRRKVRLVHGRMERWGAGAKQKGGTGGWCVEGGRDARLMHGRMRYAGRVRS